MWLSDISIKRPVLATVMSLVILLFGIVTFFMLPVREYPDIDPPIVSVSTLYQGASPETVEATITEPLEDELISIEGIKSITSSSRDQLSNITIEFELTRNIDVAAQDVRDRVSRARRRLPQEIDEPVIAKQDTDDQPILWLGLSGENFSLLQLTDFADRYIVDHLQTISGVGRVNVSGLREFSMRLWLDPMKMASHGITAEDIETALKDKNVETPSGRIESQFSELPIKTEGDLSTAEMFNNLIIKTVKGVPIYLKDIGRAEIGPRDDRSLVRFNGKPAVGLGIIKQSKANTLDVAHAVKDKIQVLKNQLPPGMNLEPAYDASLFIERSIKEVKESLMVAGLLVVFVIYLFLRNVRSAIIPAISIPVSIIGTFSVMYSLGFTINTFTLLALTLSVGLVVDDTIVVLENINRHIELGKTPLQAAIEGTREIGFAILATTITLVAVFVPIGFNTGTTGRLFYEFAIAIASSVLISGFVSLSLSPMLCSKLLKPFSKLSEERSFSFSGFYRPFLYWSLSHPKTIIFISLLMIAVSFTLTRFIPSELLPIDDRGSIMTTIKAPEGVTLAYTDKAVRQAEAMLHKVPEVSRYFSVLAFSNRGSGRVNEGIIFSTLLPWKERETKQQKIVEKLQSQMKKIPEASVFPMNPPSGPRRGSRGSIQVVLQGFNLQELNRYSEEIIAKAKDITGIMNLDSNLELNKPQVEVHILRERAEELGTSPKDIARALQVLFGGVNITDFTLYNKRYDVMLQADRRYREFPEAIKTIMVKGHDDQMIPLANVVEIKESVAPNELSHYNRLRSITISGSNVPSLITLGDALKKIEKIASETLPSSIQLTYAGESKELKDAGKAFYWTFAFAILMVYLVLSAQFESFKHPFVILLTVPLAICGAILTLFFTNSSINAYSQIGMVLLIGLVTKNGILIVEYANRLRKIESLRTEEAIFQAALIRLRPILMTSIATIFGALPIALALGAGSESRQTMGITIIGGMIFSTFLTLFLIPVVYKLLNRKESSLSQEVQPMLER